MTTTKQITDLRVTWTADHEQYYQGHSITFSDYTHSGQGCGETLREAFEDALDSLAQQVDVGTQLDEPRDTHNTGDSVYPDLIRELEGQVKEPEMLDWDIVRTEFPAHGTPDGCGCAACAGEWHFYVNVDVKVEGE